MAYKAKARPPELSLSRFATTTSRLPSPIARHHHCYAADLWKVKPRPSKAFLCPLSVMREQKLTRVHPLSLDLTTIALVVVSSYASAVPPTMFVFTPACPWCNQRRESRPGVPYRLLVSKLRATPMSCHRGDPLPWWPTPPQPPCTVDLIVNDYD